MFKKLVLLTLIIMVYEILSVLSDKNIDELVKRYNVWVAQHYNNSIIDRQIIKDKDYYNIFIFSKDVDD